MEFTALPPEVTSALIHSGPGAESLVEASGRGSSSAPAWKNSAEIYAAALVVT